MNSIFTWLKSPEELFRPFSSQTEPRNVQPAPAPAISLPVAAPPPVPDRLRMGEVSAAAPGRALSLSFLEQLKAPATPPAAAALPAKVNFEKAVQLRAGVHMYVPQQQALRPDGSVDIILQFRGDVPQRFSEGGVPAVVISAETEGLSAAMMEKFGHPDFVPQLLETALTRLRRQYGPQVRLGRLALGSFSAGYAPLRVALANPAVRARTDAVLIIDGIHYGKAGKPEPGAHQPFVDFAREAAQGERLMVITHSAIQPNYSSSSDAADYILSQVGVARQPAGAEAPPPWSNRYGSKPQPITRADRGHLHVEGYAGGVARSHVEQIDNLGNLWSRYLAPRWQ